ncbi:glycosyltransferase family 4 protein [Eubacterium coprostanoligenes]|uniref:Glycosyltransferase involved in cell wall bisynthesis n=1 Tax=Eubacterium coprostanoligenes TaxID=290054 RepID=A0A1T4K4F7_9FIRM|nr:glycosyltransferase family 4 protein [Eubacterium coprostanoligenes]SJZ37324.1 Glycosyltransferase involved in cell wall bisynthesis [Eubacterium coprostanoligenes]
MKIYEIGTGYTSIPAKISAATEIIIEQLTYAMIENGEDVTIIDIEDKNRKSNSLPITEIKVPLFSDKTDTSLGIIHKIKRVLYSIAVVKKLKNILKNSKEKIFLHFHNQYNMFFFLKLTSAKEREKCICAYTNHSGIWTLDWNESKDIINKRYFQEAECMKKADYLFVLNNKTKENAINHLGVNKDKIFLISHGVNTDIYKPLSVEEIEKTKSEMNLSNKKIILQIGSVNENKGQKRTLQMLLPLMKERQELVYAYAGGIVDENYQNEILKFAKVNQIEHQIKYLGMIPPGEELNRIYNIAEATIVPSKFESFCLVVIESFSAGVPVLLDENSSFSFSESALLYTADNFEQVIKDNILDNKEQQIKLKKEVRENALNNYNWNAIAKQYTQI